MTNSLILFVGFLLKALTGQKDSTQGNMQKAQVISQIENIQNRFGSFEIRGFLGGGVFPEGFDAPTIQMPLVWF